MRDLSQFAVFEITVAGVPFEVRRRTTELMLQIGDARQVFGLMAGATRAALAGEAEAIDKLADATARYLAMQRKAAALIFTKIDGDPVSPEDPPAWDAVAPFMDAVFESFLASGLDADPMPDSCGGRQESR